MAFKDSEIVQFLWTWLQANYVQLIIACVVLLISTVVLIFTVRYIKRLENKKKLTENYSKMLIRIVRGIYSFVFIFSILVAFNITVGAITGAIALLGGTIIGFAAVNTIGNALAGLIIMISKPIHIGDRILHNGSFADVISIELIFTRLRTLDKAIVLIPNQELLTGEICNYGKDEVVRRNCVVTIAYEDDYQYIESILLKALKGIDGVLKEPVPKVRITDFQNFAVEYKLFYSIKEIHRVMDIDSNVKKKILEVAKQNDIDLRTPNLSLMLSANDKK